MIFCFYSRFGKGENVEQFQGSHSRKEYFLNSYGLFPKFKAGLSLGLVTVAEVGELKTEIAYHGDVLNTTARMTSQCRILGKDLLVSQALYDNVTLSEEYSVQDVGEAQFRGKELYTNLFYIWPTES